MRKTNNGPQSDSSGDSDTTWYVVYDTDTGEHLVEWDDYEDIVTAWARLDFFSDYPAQNEFDRIKFSARCSTPEDAEELLKSVGAALCERFPDDQINLVIHRVHEIVTHSVEVKEYGRVQTFGEDPEVEEVEEDVVEVPPRPVAPKKDSKRRKPDRS